MGSLALAYSLTTGYCAELPDTGFCKENIPRWYYNPFSERCARFTYGGCYGNKNNFEEEQQCLESCRGISSEQSGSSGLKGKTWLGWGYSLLYK